MKTFTRYLLLVLVAVSMAIPLHAENGDMVSVTPDPANGMLEQIPAQIVLTFKDDIQSVDKASVMYGRGETVTIEDSQISKEGKVVTVNLPVSKLVGLDSFTLLVKVTDTNGKHVTVGDVEDYVSVLYDVEPSSANFLFNSVTPSVGDVEELSNFSITLVNNRDQGDFIGGFDDSKEIVLKNGSGQVVAKGKASFDPDAWNTVFSVRLDSVIKEKGTYALVIPEGLVFNSAYDPNSEDFGISWGAICNPQLVLNYYIGTATGIDVAVSVGKMTSIYKLNGVKVRNSVNGLPKGIYVVNGKKMIVK